MGNTSHILKRIFEYEAQRKEMGFSLRNMTQKEKEDFGTFLEHERQESETGLPGFYNVNGKSLKQIFDETTPEWIPSFSCLENEQSVLKTREHSEEEYNKRLWPCVKWEEEE